jgi:hypothetical protein
MMFTIEFFRIREKDNAHAMLDRITHIASDLESAKVKAKSLFDTLNLPQNPDGLRTRTDMRCSFGRQERIMARWRTLISCVLQLASTRLWLRVNESRPSGSTLRAAAPPCGAPPRDAQA